MIKLSKPIKTEIEVDKLRSQPTHPLKKEIEKEGFYILDKLVKELTQFRFLKDYQRNPHLEIEKTDFYKGMELANKIRFRKVGNVGKVASMRLIRFYEETKRGRPIDTIQVMARYDGKFVFRDGLHRASIAAALGLEKIFADIVGVDRNLELLMESLKRAAYGDYHGHKVLYTPIGHPIFNDWKVLRDKTRWDLIREEFEWKDKSVLDIGCYTGHFSHEIRKMRGHVTGIDVNNQRLNIARKLNTLLELDVNFVLADLFKFLPNRKFDCILFLGVLHWILYTGGLKAAKVALDLISSATPVMFFVMRRMLVKEWKGGAITERKTIPDFILSNSSFERYSYLGNCGGGREVFKFEKKK